MESILDSFHGDMFRRLNLQIALPFNQLITAHVQTRLAEFKNNLNIIFYCKPVVLCKKRGHFSQPTGNITVFYKGWGLSHGNYLFLARLTDHEETWKYTNGSGCC